MRKLTIKKIYKNQLTNKILIEVENKLKLVNNTLTKIVRKNYIKKSQIIFYI